MKKNVNKSALIKEIFAKNPSWKASEIAAQMKKDGTPVSLPLVYQAIRNTGSSKVKSAGKKRGPKPRVAVESTVAASSTSDLFTAMQSFVNAAGGLDKAISILSLFQK
jgi:arginine repressor